MCPLENVPCLGTPSWIGYETRANGVRHVASREQTQKAMEICAMGNARAALDAGKLNNPVIEQIDME